MMRIDSIFQAFAGVFLSYGVLKTDAPVDLEKLLSDLQPEIDQLKIESLEKVETNWLKDPRETSFGRLLKSALAHSSFLPILRKLGLTKYFNVSVYRLRRLIKEKKEREVENIVSALDVQDKPPTRFIDPKTDARNLSLGFSKALERTLDFVQEIFLGGCDILKMEQMVADPEYLSDRLLAPILGNQITISNVNEMIPNYQRPINAHRNQGPKTAEEVFSCWPRLFQVWFMRKLDALGTTPLYRSQGYDLPSMDESSRLKY